jgi:hypothetical protein
VVVPCAALAAAKLCRWSRSGVHSHALQPVSGSFKLLLCTRHRDEDSEDGARGLFAFIAVTSGSSCCTLSPSIRVRRDSCPTDGCTLAHRLNAAPWLWLPEAVNNADTFHVGLASMILDRLNPTLPVFFEFAHGLLYNQVGSTPGPGPGRSCFELAPVFKLYLQPSESLRTAPPPRAESHAAQHALPRVPGLVRGPGQTPCCVERVS